MRRASLVAPLLLIAIGVLFLARNVYPDFPLAQYIARYWPYVLILWGAVRIAEISYWASSSEPLPAHGLSAGEWLLALFLCVIGMGMHVVALGNLRWWPERIPWAGMQAIGERYDYPVSGEKASSKTPRIVIDDYRGDLQITGSDTDVVKITGRKSIRAFEKIGADHADKTSAFELTGDAGEMRLRLHEGAGFARISSSLEMTVPKGASLEAKRRDGELRISHVQGSVSVSGRTGDVDVHDVGGPVSVEVAFAGDVRLQDLAKAVRFKSPRTEFSAAAVPGEVRLTSGDIVANGLTGPVRLTASSRDVNLRDVRNALQIEVDRGDVTLEPGDPLARLEASVHSGDVNLVLPENASFSMKATTKSGEISNGLGASFQVNSGDRRQTLQGSTGNGPQITIDVDRGNISVRKGTGKLPAKDVAHPLETINQ